MTFFFYDLETSGLDPRQARIMQFAGQRTTPDLEPIGDPYNLLLKLDPDTIPDAGALKITGLDPKQDGLTEAEFAQKLHDEIFTPATTMVGFNSIGFDDEFLRFTFWRTFHDPYAWAYAGARSRWDILNLVRATRALRPDGINWPIKNDKPTNRLEELTAANRLEHTHAHDALSDVFATIAVARLIKSTQPKLFDYLLRYRGKASVTKLLSTGEPLVYTDRRIKHSTYTTVILPVRLEPDGKITALDARSDDLLWLRANRCPTLAPLTALTDDNWQSLEIDPETVFRASEAAALLAAEQADQGSQEAFDLGTIPREAPTLDNVDGMLYDGFLEDSDRHLCDLVRNSTANQLADLHPEFRDERLTPLLLLYKARNFPTSLSADEQKSYQAFTKRKAARLIS